MPFVPEGMDVTLENRSMILVKKERGSGLKEREKQGKKHEYRNKSGRKKEERKKELCLFLLLLPI